MLAACELLLRALSLSPGQYRLDAELGVDRVPHSLVFVGREGGAPLRFDRYGLNNDDAIWDRPGPRIGILGDSFVEAAEVPRAENWVARLDAALPGATVLNLGRAALGPAEMVALYRRIAAQERLDAVVVGLSDTDLDDLAADREIGPGCSLPPRQFSARQRATAALLAHSVLLTRLQQRLRLATSGPAMHATTPRPAPPMAETTPDPAMVTRLAACLQAIGAAQPTLVLLLPHGVLPQGPPGPPQQRRLASFRAAAAQAGLPVIDAAGGFGSDPLGDGRFVNGFANATLGGGHLNPLGHARLATLMQQALPPLLPGQLVVTRR